MTINKLDLSVAILAGVSCLVTLVGFPVWALFIGWAWYFALASGSAPFKAAIPPMFAGSLLAVAAIVVIDLLAPGLGVLLSMIISVVITVFLLMLTLKLPGFGASLVSFNAYSCMFAGYYAGSFPAQGSYFAGFIVAIVWITGANFLGLVFGWASIKAPMLIGK